MPLQYGCAMNDTPPCSAMTAAAADRFGNVL